jgi:Tfp pilus assembly protein PilN
MLRTNLATRPFYNERGVHAILAVAALLALVLTIFNVSQIVVLSRRQSALTSQAEAAEGRAAQLRSRAVRTRQSIDAKQLDRISMSAREVNDIIGQRLFSWTELLNRLETTMPDEVRITSLRPQVGRDGVITLQMSIIGRSLEDIAAFIAALEATPAFSDVYPRENTRMEDGQLQAVIEGKYAAAH